MKNDHEGVGEILKLLSFVPYRVECRFDLNQFEMIGISPLFEESSRSFMPPDYSIHLSVLIDEETQKRTVGIHKVEKVSNLGRLGHAIDPKYPLASYYEAPPQN